MRKLNSKELREEWIKFYEERGHKNIGAVSLVGDGTTGVLFNVAGMQPLMPYLLGEKHPLGKRLCNVQGCVRTNDIESVGDSSHASLTPSPWHASHLPPFVLNENLPLSYPLMSASGVLAYTSRIDRKSVV